VSYYNDARGFGFLSVKGEADSIFFHLSEIKDEDVYSAYAGQRFTFLTKTVPKGLAAYDIEMVKE